MCTYITNTSLLASNSVAMRFSAICQYFPERWEKIGVNYCSLSSKKSRISWAKSSECSMCVLPVGRPLLSLVH